MRFGAGMAVALLLAACGGGAAASHNKTSGHAATPSPAAAAAATPTPAGAKAARSAGGAAPAAPAAAPVPAALHLPVPGTYSATSSRNGTSSDITMAYQVGATSGGTTPVTVTINNGQNGQLINHYSWTSSGIYLLETDAVTSAGRYNCVFQAPMLQTPVPLHSGSHWSSSGTCSTSPPNQATTTLRFSGGVVGAAWQAVGGVNAATWEIKGTLDTEISGTYSGGALGVGPTPYDFKSSATLDDFLDPGAGLDLHDVSTGTTTTNGKTSTTTTEIKVTSLRPS